MAPYFPTLPLLSYRVAVGTFRADPLIAGREHPEVSPRPGTRIPQPLVAPYIVTGMIKGYDNLLNVRNCSCSLFGSDSRVKREPGPHGVPPDPADSQPDSGMGDSPRTAGEGTQGEVGEEPDVPLPSPH